MIAFSLEIEGTSVDLHTDETIRLHREIKDLLNVATTKTDFSQQFTIPATERNNPIFSNYFEENIQLGSWNAFLKLDARILVHSIPIFQGCVELVGVKFKNGNPSFYDVVFYGQVKNALTEFQEDTLIDADWSALDHTVNYTNVINSWDGTLLSGAIIYPLVDWGNNYTYSTSSTFNLRNLLTYGATINDFRPFVRLKTMVETLFSAYGYTLGGTLFARSEFDDMYVAPMGQAGPIRNPNNTDAAIEVNCTSTGVSSTTSGWTKVPMNTAVVDVLGLWSTSAYEYTAQISGEYTFKFSLDVSIFSAGIMYLAALKNGSVSDQFTPKTSAGLTEYEFNVSLKTGDKLAIGYRLDAGSVTISNATLETLAVPFGIDGSTLSLSSVMPDVKIKDFLNSLLKTFNAVLVNADDDTVEIHNIDDWYSSGTLKDFTKYIDTESIEHRKLKVPKTIKMSHQESEDFTNEAFYSLNNRRFGSVQFSPEIDFSDSDLVVNTMFTVIPPPLLFQSNSVGLYTSPTDLPLIYVGDTDGEPMQIDFLLAYYAGKKSINSTYLIDFNTQTEFAVMSPFSDYPTSSSTSKSLAFGLEACYLGDMPTNTLYMEYWQPYLSRLYATSSRLVTMTAIVPVGEWLNLDLNDTLAISGNYYKIQTVDYDLLNQKAVFQLITYPDIELTNYSSTRNFPSWTLGNNKDDVGKTLFNNIETPRRITNSRQWGGVYYPSMNDQVFFKSPVNSLINQMEKVNEQAQFIKGYNSSSFSLSVSGAAQGITLANTLNYGNEDLFTSGVAGVGGTYLSPVFNGQYHISASVAFEQVGGKDLKFYIAIDGLQTLAQAYEFGGSGTVAIETTEEIGAGSEVTIMVQDTNGETHSIDIELITLKLERL